MKGEIDSNTLNYLAREIVKGDKIKGETVSNNYIASEIFEGYIKSEIVLNNLRCQ